MVKKEWGFDTLVVHGMNGIDPQTGAVAPAIYQTSTFTFKDSKHGEALFRGEADGYIYTRISNPTTEHLEHEMALLEGGEAALAFSSGLAAIASLVMTLCKHGENFVSSNTIYGGTHSAFMNFYPRMGIEAREARGTHLDELEAAIDDKTRFIFIETPANPNLDIIDIEGCARIAHEHSLPLVVDNTFASPALQKPLKLGADYVMHSATKYISGHGDVIAGIVVGSKEQIDIIRHDTMTPVGYCISPFNSWLLLRGLKTLSVRMKRHCENAMHVAQYLNFHPRIKEVYYPGLRQHPGHELASRQMSGFGGMIAFTLDGSREECMRMIDALELCVQAVSLGDCDTLICHPASTTQSSYTPEQLKAAGIAENMIRISVGIEDPMDICNDLGQAIKSVK